jgi:hypothetical protein
MRVYSRLSAAAVVAVLADCPATARWGVTEADLMAALRASGLGLPLVGEYRLTVRQRVSMPRDGLSIAVMSGGRAAGSVRLHRDGSAFPAPATMASLGASASGLPGSAAWAGPRRPVPAGGGAPAPVGSAAVAATGAAPGSRPAATPAAPTGTPPAPAAPGAAGGSKRRERSPPARSAVGPAKVRDRSRLARTNPFAPLAAADEEEGAATAVDAAEAAMPDAAAAGEEEDADEDYGLRAGEVDEEDAPDPLLEPPPAPRRLWTSDFFFVFTACQTVIHSVTKKGAL